MEQPAGRRPSHAQHRVQPNPRSTALKPHSSRCIRAKRQRFVRRGTPDDYTEVSVGFITSAVVVISGFVAAVVLAVRASGAVRTISFVAAVVLGALILWTTLLMGFSSLMVRLIRRSKADS